MLRTLCLLGLFVVSPALAITGNSCSITVNGVVGNAVSVPTACTTISVFTNPNINFVSGTPMPPGMLITKSSSSGGNATWQISGTPTSAGSGSAVYSFTDSNPGAVTISITYSVLGPVTPSGSFGAATVGRAYVGGTVTSTGGTGSGYSYGVVAGALPGGMTMSSAGVVSGTPIASGTANFTVQSTDSASNSGSAAFSIVVYPAVSTGATATLSRTVGQSFSTSYAATGGAPSPVYTISSGSLPAGAVLSGSTGGLSGTATSAASGSFTVTATDPNGSTADKVVNYAISPTPAIAMATPTGSVNAPWSQPIVFTGSLASANLASGALPAGLLLSSGGTVLSGTPTQTGTFNFTLSGTDSNGVAASASFTLVITAPLVITTSSLPGGTTGTAYSASVAATGGTPPITFSVTSGVLPAGLALAVSGAISGTPTVPGAQVFTITATDANSNTTNASLSIQVLAPPVNINTTTLPQATLGQAYSATVAATGGAGGLTFNIAAGTLPSGISLSSAGVFSGTPTQSGSFNITVTATDAYSNFAARPYTLMVAAPPIVLSTTTLSGGTIGAPYTAAIQASGGAGALTFSITAGTLPAGLNFASSGQITGTPMSAGTSAFTVSATDAYSNSASRAYAITVISPITITTNPNLSAATVGAPVSIQFEASGGTPPLNWTIAGQAAPGLQMVGGLLFGAPTAAGWTSFTVNVSDSNGASASLIVNQPVNPVLAIVNTNAGGPYSRNGFMQLQMKTTGGTLPLEWSIAQGALPPGVTLNPSTGRLAGSFFSTGTYPFVMRVSDQAGAVATRSFTVQVTNGPQFSQAPLPAATAGTPYRAPVEVYSTLPIVEWQISWAEAFPPGLQLVDREISGIPSKPGAYDFELTVRDQGGSSAVARLLFTVNPPLELLEAAPQPDLPRGKPFSWMIPRRGGSAPFRFQLLNGSLPGGLQLNGQTGEISGVAQTSGEFGFTVGVTDANGASTHHFYSLRPSQGFRIYTESLPGILAPNRDVRIAMEVEGGVPPFVFEVASGQLPTGVVLSGNTLVGRTLSMGVYEARLKVTDTTGAAATALWSTQVSDGMDIQPRSLGFTPISDSPLGIPFTLKWASAPAAGPVRIESQAAWLRTSSMTAGVPGTVEVWIEPAFLPPGQSTTELLFTSGSTTTRIPVRAERLRADPANWWIETTPTPGGGWAALLKGEAARIPFRASIAAAPQSNPYRLSESAGEIYSPEAFLLWLERDTLIPAAAARPETSLEIRNMRTGDTQELTLPTVETGDVEISTPLVPLTAQVGATRSSSFAVVFRSTRRVPHAVAVVSTAAWLQVERVTAAAVPDFVLNFYARTTGLAEGVYTATVDLYNDQGRRFDQLPIQLLVTASAPAVELSSHGLRLTRLEPEARLTLTNPAKSAVPFQFTSRSTLLTIEPAQGEIPAGREVTVTISAKPAAMNSWSRQPVLAALGSSTVELVEVDLALANTGGACPAPSPVVSFVSPGQAFTAKVDQSVPLRIAVRNGCGEPLGGDVLTVRIPGSGPVSLFQGSDGVWYGNWIPVEAIESLQIEAIWLDPRTRTSVSRYLTGTVRP